jgi:uncharacterized membrane protein YdjX (TVP38/TMEM64 family)
MSEPDPETRRSSGSDDSPRRLGTRAGWAAMAVVAIGASLIARQVPVGRALDLVSRRVEGLGVWGPLAFGLAYTAAVLLLVPAWPFTIAAGAIFGPVVGAITAWIASNIGAALAFLLARGLARDAVANRLRGDPRFEAIDRAVADDGWKIVGLLRLSPAIPFGLQNYAYGLTGIPFRTHALTTAIAMLPGTLLYISLGHVGRAGLEAAGDPRSRTPGEWALLAVGLLATIGATAMVGWLVRRSLKDKEGGR